jgi:uncharacterized protein YndB with AHSA1/START domain
MPQVRVKILIGAPIEQVFDAVSDHERFLAASDGTKTTILRDGARERCGLGCLREVRVGRRAWYLEEITAWQRPSYFDYTIRKSSVPIRHERSRLTFRVVDTETEVEWTSRFEIPIPVVGRLMGIWAQRLYATAFINLLLAAKSRLETQVNAIDPTPIRKG